MSRPPALLTTLLPLAALALAGCEGPARYRVTGTLLNPDRTPAAGEHIALAAVRPHPPPLSPVPVTSDFADAFLTPGNQTRTDVAGRFRLTMNYPILLGPFGHAPKLKSVVIWVRRGTTWYPTPVPLRDDDFGEEFAAGHGRDINLPPCVLTGTPPAPVPAPEPRP